MCCVVQAEPKEEEDSECGLLGDEEVEVCSIPVSVENIIGDEAGSEIGDEVPATAATTGNNNTQPITDSQEHGDVSAEFGTDDTATAFTTDNLNTQPSTNTDISLEHGMETAVLGTAAEPGTAAELWTGDMTTAATTHCIEPSVAGTSTLPELGELALAGTSSEVSSECTVAEETYLEDTVADACSGDAAADTSSVNGAARPQHSSDQCHDS